MVRTHARLPSAPLWAARTGACGARAHGTVAAHAGFPSFGLFQREVGGGAPEVTFGAASAPVRCRTCRVRVPLTLSRMF